MQNKPVLAFDCSAAEASVALKAGGTVHARTLAHGRQAAELVSTIDALLKEHRVHYAGLGAIVTTTGPGSFTGLRIALAVLHGLVLANPTLVKTLTSTQAVAWDIASRKDTPAAFTVALSAGKGELFRQRFIMKNRIPAAQGDIELMAPGALEDDLPVFGNTLPAGDARYIAGPAAAVLCGVEAQLAETHIAEALPLYIRPPDAKVPQPFAWLAKEAL